MAEDESLGASEVAAAGEGAQASSFFNVVEVGLGRRNRGREGKRSMPTLTTFFSSTAVITISRNHRKSGSSSTMECK